jgi:hypothetical protein
MSGMFKKKKGGDDGMSAQIAEQQRQRDLALGELRTGADEAGNLLTEGQNRFNVAGSQQLFDKALSNYNNFDTNAQTASDEAYNANYAPILNEIRGTLGNQFAGMGNAGRNNSRGQYAQAVLGNELSTNAGKQLLDIRNNARNQLLNEYQNIYSPAFANQQQISGFDTNKANIRQGLGLNLANARGQASTAANNLVTQNAEMQAGQQASQKGGIGSLLGAGMGAVSSIAKNMTGKK